MREEVRKPFGRIFQGSALIEACRRGARPFVSVGDQCTSDLIDAG